MLKLVSDERDLSSRTPFGASGFRRQLRGSNDGSSSREPRIHLSLLAFLQA
jgi:hypothetical protein